MPEWISVLVLGLIEGVTEFLPISSTGHLVIAEQWLPHRSELFNFVIQSGAVLAVLAAFWGRLGELLRGWRDRPTQLYVFKLAVAFGIAAVGGLAAKKAGMKLPETVAPVAWATLIGGLAIFAIEWRVKGRVLREEVTWGTAAAVGLAQVAAFMFPGTSRSGATILVALLLGTARPAATEFSFLLGVPSILAAGAYEILSYYKHPSSTPESWGMVWLGTLVAAVTAFGVVKWLLGFVRGHTFLGFGWYRVLLGGVLLVWWYAIR